MKGDKEGRLAEEGDPMEPTHIGTNELCGGRTAPASSLSTACE